MSKDRAVLLSNEVIAERIHQYRKKGQKLKRKNPHIQHLGSHKLKNGNLSDSFLNSSDIYDSSLLLSNKSRKFREALLNKIYFPVTQ